jgi:hypothetical protein
MPGFAHRAAFGAAVFICRSRVLCQPRNLWPFVGGNCTGLDIENRRRAIVGVFRWIAFGSKRLADHASGPGGGPER